MHIKDIFVTPLIVEKLHLDNSAIEKYCLEVDSLTFPKEKLDCDSPALVELKNSVLEVTKTLHSHLNFSKNYEFYIDNIWVNNDNKNPSIYTPHIHWNSIFSAVYYVNSTADSAKLQLMNPVSALPHVINSSVHIEANNIFNSELWFINPSVGDLVIFPAWIYHSVSANQPDDATRMSIAMNLQLRKK
jgi:uncharacterized protein (TIGR02466 family)